MVHHELLAGELTLTNAQLVGHLLDFASGRRKGPADAQKPPPFETRDRFPSKRSMLMKLASHYEARGFQQHLLADAELSQDRLGRMVMPPFASTIFATVEWSNNIVWYMLKGRRSFWLCPHRVKIAQARRPACPHSDSARAQLLPCTQECLFNLNEDGRLR